jgi:PAS domain S-box-containing protein
MGARQNFLGRRKDGSTFSVEINLSRVQIDDEVLFCSAVRDVSQRKSIEEQLRESEDRFRMLVEDAPDGIFITDAGGRYQDVNPAGWEMLGYSHDEILAMSITDVLAPEEIPRLDRELRRLSGGRPVRSEWRFRRKDGSSLYGEVHARQLSDSRILGHLRDVSQSRRVEDELRASQKFIEAVAKASPPVIYVFDVDEQRLTYANRPMLAGLGYAGATAAIEGLQGFRAFIPDDESAHLERVLCEWSGLGDGQIRDDEYRLLDAEGHVHWFLGREVAFARNVDGSVRQILGTLYDVTERRRADAQLRESESLLRGLVETSPLPMLVVTADADHQVLSMNQRFTETFGYTIEDVPGVAAWWTRAYPDVEYRELVRAAWNKAVADADVAGSHAIVPVAARATCLDGSVREIEAHMGRFGNRALVVFSDLTERKQTEELLRRSEERYRLIVENQTEFIVKWLPDGTRTFVNESYCRTFGVREQDCIGTSFLPLVSPEYRATIVGQTAALTPEAPEYTDEHVSLVVGGRRWQQWTNRGIFDATGRLVEVLSTGRDVTERREAEEKLRQSQLHLVASQRIARVGSWEMDLVSVDDLSKNPIRWSDECFRIFGYAPGEIEVSGDVYLDRVHPDDRQKVRQAAVLAVKSRSGYFIDYRVVLRDGTERIVHEQAELVVDPPTRAPVRFIGTAQDITDRVRLEEQLRQSQKMQAIGQLAGGVAHDFNNLLTIINGHAEMLLDGKRAEAPDRVELTAIRDAGERAALLTRQLLLFSRKAMLEPRVLDCNALVQRTSQMLRRLISEDVAVSTILAPSLRRIRADMSQIEQILLNLSLNACDAMPRGGRLRIETRNVAYDAEFCRVHPEYKIGQYVQLIVADTGIGMTPHVKAHLFEPFFTTKGPGKGTGLGLATVYGIVQESGGFIAVSSELDAGTTFSVCLPALDGEDMSRERNPVDRDRLRGHETILLVEDDAAVRHIAKLALTKYGYHVLEATDGASALEIVGAYEGVIDALVSDMAMPGMNGRMLADAVRASRPRCRVLFMSGYNEDMLVRRGVHTGVEAFIQKPFAPDALVGKLRQTLDRRREAEGGLDVV